MFQSLLCILRIVLCLGLIIFIILGAFFWLPANIHYHVTEKYTFSGGAIDTPVYLGVILPKSGPYQQVENVQISWDGVWQEEDFGFVDAAKLSGMKRGNEELVGTIEYDVKLPQGPVSWFDPVKDFQRLPQAGIESDCECMLAKASSLNDGVSTMDAYKIYAYTAEYLTYSEEQMDCTSVSAIEAYQIGLGVCAAYARLMTALCRASEIPAQMVLGLTYPDPMFKPQVTNVPQKPEVAHAWVEFYAGERWSIADPTWGARYPKFMQFGRNDARHLVYGELEQILIVDNSLEIWAQEQAQFVLNPEGCFRYSSTSDSNQVSFLPVMSIRRTWDGRWVNTLIVWVIMVAFIMKFRDKLVGLPGPQEGKPNLEV